VKVYILFSNYYDYCENWESIVDIYAEHDDAELAMIELEEANTNTEQQSYYISEREVK
jgi:hypothetical protein